MSLPETTAYLALAFGSVALAVLTGILVRLFRAPAGIQPTVDDIQPGMVFRNGRIEITRRLSPSGLRRILGDAP